MASANIPPALKDTTFNEINLETKKYKLGLDLHDLEAIINVNLIANIN